MASGEADAHAFHTPNGENQDLGFLDFLDVINPLQHLPVVGGIYRQLTGDQMSPAAHAAGGFLWGGPISLLTGAMNGAMVEETGKDVMSSMLSWLQGDSPADLPQGPDGAVIAADTAGTEGLGTAGLGATGLGATAAASTESDPAAGQTSFQGAAASRLDAFIRSNGQTSGSTNASAATLSPAAMDAMAIRQSLRLDIDTADLRGSKKAQPGAPASADNLANRIPASGSGSGSLGNWMTQALDQYDTLRDDRLQDTPPGVS
jgi:hypothetical protein